jgi:hypothetical protein
MTLLEVLIVVTLAAVVGATAVRGFRSLMRSDLRGSAAKLSGAIRYLFDRASTTGRIHRLVIDFENGKYWAEVTDGRTYMTRERETAESREAEAEARAEEEREEKERKERGEDVGSAYDMTRYMPKDFRPRQAQFQGFRETAVKPVTLKAGIKIASLYTPRLAEPMSSGQGYIYFFPLGQTEAAVVHVSDEDAENVFTLTVHPLTGRVKVDSGYVAATTEAEVDDEGSVIER